jgi:release factor glutamine methyltransferase
METIKNQNSQNRENSKDLWQKYRNKLIKEGFESSESSEIVFLILEKILKISKTDVISQKNVNFTPENESLIENIFTRLLTYEPLQYILEEAFFLGRSFFVNPSVLIPRPETEELVDRILKEHKQQNLQYESKNSLKILDIGTGSGCIPISLKLELPENQVFGLDISKNALMVAQQNAIKHDVSIEWLDFDIFDYQTPLKFDWIISNPPYITELEKTEMSKNVLDYEPHTALFVSDSQPLIFYEKIISFAATHLKSNGKLFLEINAQFGKETQQFLEKEGFIATEIWKDTSGKERFVVGQIL